MWIEMNPTASKQGVRGYFLQAWGLAAYYKMLSTCPIPLRSVFFICFHFILCKTISSSVGLPINVFMAFVHTKFLPRCLLQTIWRSNYYFSIIISYLLIMICMDYLFGYFLQFIWRSNCYYF